MKSLAILAIAGVFAVLLASFAGGYVTGRYEVPPFETVAKIDQGIQNIGSRFAKGVPQDHLASGSAKFSLETTFLSFEGEEVELAPVLTGQPGVSERA